MATTAPSESKIRRKYEKARDAWLEAARVKNDIEAEYRRTIIDPRVESCVGNCYRVSNSYGAGSRWWLYIMVLRVDDGTPVVLMAEEPEAGQPQIKIDTRSVYRSIESFGEGGDDPVFPEGHMRISRDVFMDAYGKMLAQLPPA